MRLNQIILLFILLLIANWAAAYPIKPKYLKELLIEADLVIWGTVMHTQKEDTEAIRDENTAQILVKKMIKGKLDAAQITVYYRSLSNCPVPPTYTKGEQVLLFLDQRAKGGYYTHALSYGKKTLSQAEWSIYQKRIEELRNILAISGSEHQEQMKTWIMACLLEPCTVREVSGYYLDRRKPVVYHLEDGNLERLASYLKGLTTWTERDKDLLFILRFYNYANTVTLVRQQVYKVYEQPQRSWKAVYSLLYTLDIFPNGIHEASKKDWETLKNMVEHTQFTPKEVEALLQRIL